MEAEELPQRSLPEIVAGWRRGTCLAGCCTRWTHPVTNRILFGEPPPAPTVDDMLRWLHSQPSWTAVEIRSNHGWSRVKVFDELGPSIDVAATTLHAALAGAVIRVDDRRRRALSDLDRAPDLEAGSPDVGDRPVVDQSAEAPGVPLGGDRGVDLD